MLMWAPERARVSSPGQEKEGFSISAQQRLLREYAQKHSLIIVEEYVDVETAKRSGRTAFTAMMGYLNPKEEPRNLSNDPGGKDRSLVPQL